MPGLTGFFLCDLGLFLPLSILSSSFIGGKTAAFNRRDYGGEVKKLKMSFLTSPDLI